MSIHKLSQKPGQARQKGIVLFVALVVLVIMSLAGISMMRQVSVGQVIAGNLALKQGATSSADQGAEAARVFILPPTATTTLDATNLGTVPGYFSSTATAFDPTTYNWDAANASVEDTAGDGAGNRVQHVTHRLCPSPGMVESQLCTTLVTTSGGSKGGPGNYTDPSLPQAVQPYFRVTTRVSGPRNTTSYTQVILY